MWKIAIGFVLFAGLAMFVLLKSGGDIDLGGEKHGIETSQAASAASTAASSASAPTN